MSFIYLHFSYRTFLTFCSIDWFRFQKPLAIGPFRIPRCQDFWDKSLGWFLGFQSRSMILFYVKDMLSSTLIHTYFIGNKQTGQPDCSSFHGFIFIKLDGVVMLSQILPVLTPPIWQHLVNVFCKTSLKPLKPINCFIKVLSLLIYLQHSLIKNPQSKIIWYFKKTLPILYDYYVAILKNCLP